MPSSQTAMAAIVSLPGTPLIELVMSKVRSVVASGAAMLCWIDLLPKRSGEGPAPAAEDANVNRDWLALAAAVAEALRTSPFGSAAAAAWAAERRSRDSRRPCLHDQGARFAARGSRRHVLVVAAREGGGLIVRQADMPFTDSGLCADITSAQDRRSRREDDRSDRAGGAAAAEASPAPFGTEGADQRLHHLRTRFNQLLTHIVKDWMQARTRRRCSRGKAECG
jgi:hypothetical protein